jgi:hypothetical protein
MASLLEIANVPRQVEVRGVKVDVTGVSAMGLASLMARFPDIGKLFSGITPEKDQLMALAPTALAAFIASGCGKPDDEGAEKIARNLGLGEQLDLVDEILRLTFPRGVGPFVKKLQELGVLSEVDIQSLQLSPETPKNSSPPDTPTP